MTETVLPPDLVSALKPEYVAPLVLYLTHENTQETGSLFEVGGGYVSKLRWQRSFGHNFPLTKSGIKPEDVQQQWNKIVDFSYNPNYPTSPKDAFEFIMANLSHTGADHNSDAAAPAPQSSSKVSSHGTDKKQKSRGSGNSKVNVEQALAHQFEPMTFTYTERDVMLYAIGIGAGADVSVDPDELNYVYENSDNFQVFPTFAVIPPSAALSGILSVKGLEFNPMMLLHGEQYTELLRPIPTSGNLTSYAKISNIYDKSSGAAVIMDVVTKDEQGQDMLFNQYTVFIRGLGGFGGSKGPSAYDFNSAIATMPPTVVHRERTLENQAVIYRLSGDYNPLHIDSAMAKIGNFEKPILHGLCSFGYAARAVVKHFAKNDGKRFKSIRVRFQKPVYPGETLVISMWQVDATKIIFKVRVSERGQQVLIGEVQLHPDHSSAPSSAATSSTSSSSTLPTGTGFQSEKVFQQLAQLASPDLVQKVKATYRFDLTKNGKTLYWLVDLKNGSGSVSGATENTKSDVSMALSDEDFVKLLSAKLDPQKAFMYVLYCLVST
jgi:acyl dehydratase